MEVQLAGIKESHSWVRWGAAFLWVDWGPVKPHKSLFMDIRRRFSSWKIMKKVPGHAFWYKVCYTYCGQQCSGKHPAGSTVEGWVTRFTGGLRRQRTAPRYLWFFLAATPPKMWKIWKAFLLAVCCFYLALERWCQILSRVANISVPKQRWLSCHCDKRPLFLKLSQIYF